MTRLLIANRGEIAVRIASTARDLGWSVAAVCSPDDGDTRHVRGADATVTLPAEGPAGYLDIDAVVGAAIETDSDALHPGYGFSSEDPELSRAAAAAGLAFVGPTPETLALLSDKIRSRELAAALAVPVLVSTPIDDATDLLAEQGAVMIKAAGGGGGRGMAPVDDPAQLDRTIERCAREAERGFGDGRLYAEALVREARHIEVQVIGDGVHVASLGTRECTLQRRHQKLIELAPDAGLPESTRTRIIDASLMLAAATHYRSLGTFEFLVEATDPTRWWFIEANARIQVEHTVTEMITGLDLVACQLRLADGATLDDLEIEASSPSGRALQVRVNAERVDPDGSVRPTSGTILEWSPPTGRGIRVDTAHGIGSEQNPRFDSLVAKLVVHTTSDDTAVLADKARRALDETHISGVETNLAFQRVLLDRTESIDGSATTTFVEDHLEDLVEAAADAHARSSAPRIGVVVDPDDPLAVVRHGHTAPDSAITTAAPPGTVVAPLQGTIASVAVGAGEPVAAGQPLLVMEAMKMQHVITAAVSGTVAVVHVQRGEAVPEGAALVAIEPGDADTSFAAADLGTDLGYIRPDLAEVRARHELGLDAARPDAVARRHDRGRRSARENLDHLVDPGTFIEYGPLVVAAQRRRRDLDELRANTPGDGLIGGVGSVNGDLFDPPASSAVVMSYDYTVLAGTQGLQNHRKKDRLFEIAATQRLPVVLLAEGGGGRPGDTDGLGGSGLDCLAFKLYAELSGLVPLVAITSGYCFAGNAALAGCSDVIIATEGSNIGMGGPAMIEGGGLGVFHPREVGPTDVQVANGVIDVLVPDEDAAVVAAKRYLGYFQGRTADVEVADQRLLRHVIPENRLRVYDVRRVIDIVCDDGSVMELRPDFGLGMITSLGRIDGRPLGIVANNPAHLAGAIDREGADKATRFMQLCDAHDLPLVFLCDTPGIMVGPESEKTALVRHASRMFVTGAGLDVPFCTIVLRKGYGLGAQAMAGGSFHAPRFTVAWPSGEFGGMGLEGAVKLGFRKEIESLEDPTERRVLYERLVTQMYENGKAVNTASTFEIDAVIDPAETRHWISTTFGAEPQPPARTSRKRAVDTW